MRRLLGLVLVALAVGSASAQTNSSKMGFMGIGGHLGWVDPDNLDSTLGVGVLVDFGPMLPDFRLEGNFDYWGESQTPRQVKWSYRDISLGATGKWYPDINSKVLKPFLGTGLVLHFFRTKVSGLYLDPITGGQSFSDTSTKLGLDLTGGSLFGVDKNVNLLAEIRYRFVSDIGHLCLRGGIVYYMTE
jgi:hypothetical protein